MAQVENRVGSGVRCAHYLAGVVYTYLQSGATVAVNSFLNLLFNQDSWMHKIKFSFSPD